MTGPTAGKDRPHVVMAAAENAAFPFAKVGGMADVIKEAPPALAEHGCLVSVVIPSHGTLHRMPTARRVGQFDTRFRGRLFPIEIYNVESTPQTPDVRQWILHHDDLGSRNSGDLYTADDASRPFAYDASRFALFSRALVSFVAQWLTPRADVLHCHDWHTGFAMILRRFDSQSGIRDIKTVFTIHNLAYQGIRPFDNDESSLSAWYSDIGYDGTVIGDPRWPWCVNPMLAGIRLSDRVHTVSKSYAREITQPSDVISRGFHGGEGLEAVLHEAHEAGVLHGILNGCDYPGDPIADEGWPQLCRRFMNEVEAWLPSDARLKMTLDRLSAWAGRRPDVVVTAVSRIVTQKFALALTPIEVAPGRTDATAFEHLLTALDGQGVCVLLGTGDDVMEDELYKIAERFDNFIFLNGFSSTIADALYAKGDLFYMPSSFEPCGLSQMLAMRAGQPCLVHAVGGLKDTVTHNETGFSFSGDSTQEQASALVSKGNDAIDLLRRQPARYAEIRRNAKAARFLWADTARQYIQSLYEFDAP